MRTKRAPRRKKQPINAIRFTVINYDPEQPAAARPRSRDRIFYDVLVRLGVTFRVDSGRVVGMMPSGADASPVLAAEIQRRDQAIKRFIAEVN